MSKPQRTNFHFIEPHSLPTKFLTPKKSLFNSPETQENTEKNESLKSNSNDENKSETTEKLVKKLRGKAHKGNSLSASKNLELSKEAENLKKYLDLMSKDQKVEALSVSVDNLMFQAQKEIDCVGCFNQLQTYIQENFANFKKGSVLHGFNLYANATFGLNAQSSNEEIGRLLAELKVNSDVLQEFNKDLNIKKKDKGNFFNKSKIHRCLLHSKKPISNKNLHSIIESNINDFQDYVQIDESVFLKNLNTYFKKRRFCNTCQENILYAYERLKENAESPDNMSEEDEEDLSSDQEILNIENNPDYLPATNNQAATPKLNSEALNFHCPCKCHLVEGFTNCNCACDEKLSKYSEINDDECENIDIISIIKFCNQNKQIVFPAQIEIMKEFLSRSETDFSIHSRHTLTKEAAQEELLVCLGLTLKEKLQDHWKTRKSEEIIRLMFYNIATHCIIENINYIYNKKMNFNGQKCALEEYLQQEELKKEKLKKKRYKKREKKKTKKNTPNNNHTLTDIEEDKTNNSEKSNSIHQNNFKLHLSEDKINKNRRFLDEIPEKEREFLIRMGWGEEEYDEELLDFEINIIQMKRKELETERERFRKKLSEKFLQLIQKN